MYFYNVFYSIAGLCVSGSELVKLINMKSGLITLINMRNCEIELELSYGKSSKHRFCTILAFVKFSDIFFANCCRTSNRINLHEKV